MKNYLEGETITVEVDKETARLLLRCIYEKDPDFNYHEMGKLLATSHDLEKFLDLLGDVPPNHPEFDTHRRIAITQEEIAERDREIIENRTGAN